MDCFPVKIPACRAQALRSEVVAPSPGFKPARPGIGLPRGKLY
jgi:hypothetical protein